MHTQLAAAVFGAAAAAVVVAATVSAAVAEQQHQNDDPPPVVAAEPVADATVIVTAHRNTSGKFSRASLLIPMLFRNVKSVQKMASPQGEAVSVADSAPAGAFRSATAEGGS